MERVRPSHIAPAYAAEAKLTLTLVLLNLGRLEDAKRAIRACRRLMMRASTERNLLLHEARWFVLQGRLDDARKTFVAARDHRWDRQGGSGFLALGDAFRDASQHDLARECWTLSADRDPESASARTARDRLSVAG
jgi:tetratricopeptide (TPR) repeat protein